MASWGEALSLSSRQQWVPRARPPPPLLQLTCGAVPSLSRTLMGTLGSTNNSGPKWMKPRARVLRLPLPVRLDGTTTLNGDCKQVRA